MSEADVRVIGLVMGTHLLEDIQMDVPCGAIVIIPAEKALRSKDLWRAISQKCLAKLPSAPPPMPTASDSRVQILERDKLVLLEANRLLQIEKDQLQAENASLRLEKSVLEENLRTALQQQQTLDAILSAIRSGVSVSVRADTSKPVTGIDGSAPLFLPEEIHPKDAETRIEVKKDETSSEDVSDTRGVLRKIRSGQ